MPVLCRPLLHNIVSAQLPFSIIFCLRDAAEKEINFFGPREAAEKEIIVFNNFFFILYPLRVFFPTHPPRVFHERRPRICEENLKEKRNKYKRNEENPQLCNKYEYQGHNNTTHQNHLYRQQCTIKRIDEKLLTLI